MEMENRDFLQPPVLVTRWVVCQKELPAHGPPSWGSDGISYKPTSVTGLSKEAGLDHLIAIALSSSYGKGHLWVPLQV